MPGLYLLVLLVSLMGLGLLDFRHKLAIFIDAKRTLMTLVVCVVFFLVWDIAGIGLGIFFEGQNTLLLGVYLAENLPLEEPLFLTVLCYNALLLYQGLVRRTK